MNLYESDLLCLKKKKKNNNNTIECMYLIC